VAVTREALREWIPTLVAVDGISVGGLAVVGNGQIRTRRRVRRSRTATCIAPSLWWTLSEWGRRASGA